MKASVLVANFNNQNFISESEYQIAIKMDIPEAPFLDARKVTPYGDRRWMDYAVLEWVQELQKVGHFKVL